MVREMWNRKKRTKSSQEGDKEVKTAQELMLTWIDFYVESEKRFPMAIECVKCKKWRKTNQYKDGKCPTAWNCSMWLTGDNTFGNCDMPQLERIQELNDDTHEEFSPGMVVWAKFRNHWWPGMIEDSPEEIMYHLPGDRPGEDLYHVTFFGNKVSRQWFLESKIAHFSQCPMKNLPKSLEKNLTFIQACEKAEAAEKMSLRERFDTFSFANLYDGQFAKLTDYELPELPDDLNILPQSSLVKHELLETPKEQKEEVNVNGDVQTHDKSLQNASNYVVCNGASKSSNQKIPRQTKANQGPSPSSKSSSKPKKHLAPKRRRLASTISHTFSNRDYQDGYTRDKNRSVMHKKRNSLPDLSFEDNGHAKRKRSSSEINSVLKLKMLKKKKKKVNSKYLGKSPIRKYRDVKDAGSDEDAASSSYSRTPSPEPFRNPCDFY